MKITAEPRSDQLNADDFIGGPRDFTIAGVRAGTAEQKYDILLEGEERCWRPPLTVLRILLAAYGDEASAWKGKRVRLYRDSSVRFGPDQVGGIRVSHLSGIDRPLTVALTEKRGGKKGMHTVEPLAEVAVPAAKPMEPTPQQVAECTDVDELRNLYRAARTDETKALIKDRVAALEVDGRLVPEGVLPIEGGTA